MTSNVERLELLEEISISITGIYANQKWKRGKHQPISRFKLILTSQAATKKKSSTQHFSIRAAAYNELGQLLGSNSEFVDRNEFLGFDSKSMKSSTGSTT